MVNTLNYRLSCLGWSYFTFGCVSLHWGKLCSSTIYLHLFQRECFFFLGPPPLPHHFQLSFVYFFKVGTHKATSPRLVPGKSRMDKSHCVNWWFLLQNLVTGISIWSPRLVPEIQTEQVTATSPFV